jgi:hypothetical protein
MDINVEGVRQSGWERNAYRKSMPACRRADMDFLTTLQWIALY